ncbi:MAG: hypothetical protein A3C27_02465 [Candidatus Levybacteria bacterium RIFCSPHIGHO2_02_FULL_39_36]|nr:MAG: hypothetical protein UT20_C0013G0013 [Candidatus Levybacteria bacterium GW2011_GWA1_39_11]OGH15423.1 MAG: hypothetical protein A2689_02370 [Candidatus Levybacteria bacterium RIFCSPHIGHO2_01_FULL_38_96]OGH27455.1 MAG: hypothetical protein A3C27_02465 [Candidatus Levybacteria bacterium RIFCSPHIGHO2_02_FULL_39_36]OGH36291.1 MAG: hypothetical protein A3B43_02610 [Candidatus Levybacteria bacterium RIFCSPLOWO2_01_FULL_38_120]OGH47846.1 MAG: hypothetical protein A3G66_02165 [Candidatus Levybac
MVKKNLSIIAVIIVSIIAVLDLSNYGIPPTHDGEYHVIRFQQFYKVLSEGVLYPRWSPDFNNGFGIPLFNYVYPLPNYMAAIFHALGFGFIDSFKLNMATATIAGAIFMYLWAKKYWGDLGGIVSSVFYTFSPYHFLDIYVRGSVGEVWSLGLAPGLFWSYLNFLETRKRFFLILSGIFLALLVLAHNILALVFFGFFVIYAAFLISNGFRKIGKVGDVRDLGLIVFTGLGLAAPFWLPALLETKSVQGLQIFNPIEHFPKLYQLVYSSWGYGFSGIDPANGVNRAGQMSFQIGIANLIAFMGSIVVLFLSRNKKILLFFIVLFLATVFLITPFSIILWKNIPIMAYIQFPWRLLSAVVLITAFLAGALVHAALYKKKKKLQIVIFIALIFSPIALSIGYAKAPFYHKRNDIHYLTRSNFKDGTNSPGNSFNTRWLMGAPKKRKDKIEVLSGSPKIKITEFKSISYSFTIDSKENSKLLINTAYFPGWAAEINEKRTNISENEGRMVLALPSGTNKIRVFLDNTPIQKLSYIYFLASTLILVLYPGVKLIHPPGGLRRHVDFSGA